MKINRTIRLHLFASLISVMAMFTGCTTTNNSSSNAGWGARPQLPDSGNFPSKYKTDYGGNLYIGPNVVENGGLRFKPAHLDVCWIADGFDFNGYDVLYIAPTQTNANIRSDEIGSQDALAREVPRQLALWLAKKGIFDKLVTTEADIKPGMRVLKFQTTILKFSMGGPVPWIFRIPNEYGPANSPRSLPKFRIYGRMTEGEKTMFEFEGYRSASWLKLEKLDDYNLQLNSLDSLMLDLTDFVAAVAGKYRLR